MKYLVLLSLLISQLSFAELLEIEPPLATEGSEAVPEIVKPVDSPVEEVVKEAEPVPEKIVIETPATESLEKKKPSNSIERRKESTGTIMVGYQFVTTWLPSKKTIGYTHLFNDKWSLEGEYSWASLEVPSFIGVDLGHVKEKRYTLQARRFVGNSFHFTFGAVYSDLSAKLGSDILDNFGAEISKRAEAQNLGVTAGLGNRWQLKGGVTWGIDWIRINIPVYETNVRDNVLKDVASESDQEDVKKVLRTFNRIPTFVLFGINVGYTF